MNTKKIKECPDCASRNIIHSEIRDQIICRDCGLVYEPLSPIEDLEFRRTHKPTHIRLVSSRKPKKKAKRKAKKTKKKAKSTKKKAKKATKKKAKSTKKKAKKATKKKAKKTTKGKPKRKKARRR